MKKVRSSRITLAACVATLAILAPSAGNATEAPRKCLSSTSIGIDMRYCVRAILENLKVFCFTNMRHQPECGATARVGGEASEEGNFLSGSYLRFGATVAIYNAPGLRVTDRGILAAKWASTQETGFYETETFTLTRPYGSPHLKGRVGGCLAVQARFFVRAETGWAFGPGSEPIVAATHSHTITSPKTYCTTPVFEER